MIQTLGGPRPTREMSRPSRAIPPIPLRYRDQTAKYPRDRATRPGGVDDTDRSAAMDERRGEPPPERQTDAPCPCGSTEHPPTRIGDQLSAAGTVIGPVYVCPAQSEAGLRGVL